MTGLTYFKRFRMERDLRADLPPLAEPPEGYFLLPWDDGLMARHAEVKHLSFREEMDSTLFASLATLEGCQRLMEAIRYRSAFVPGATWLAACGPDYCGTIQAVRDAAGCGAIQNIGVTPGHRGRGLGTVLILHALHGFRSAGIARAVLEVTARNSMAIELYRRLGFQCRRTIYKPVLGAAEPVAEYIGTV
jgi:ribosomal protein S18 acetylase RimI-like enzyme